VRYPADVELLSPIHEQPGNGASVLFDIPPDQSNLLTDPILAYLSTTTLDRHEALALQRHQFRQRLFVSAARDLYQSRDVFDSLQENSIAADNALRLALVLADPPAGFAVLALGRLGSREFDLMSDADVLFVADESAGPEDARRAAERTMDSLTAYTREGTVFPVDARLRPQGREGELVTTPARLARYFSGEAQPWEAISYLKLRFVAGDLAVGRLALAAVRDGIAAMAGRPEFDRELQVMRTRLEMSDSAPNSRTCPGGEYDTDFLTGRLQAKNNIWVHGNLSERIALLCEHRLLGEKECHELSAGVEFLRALGHFVRLVTGRPGKWLPAGDHAQLSVAKLMAKMPGQIPGRSLEEALTAVLRRTREIYQRHMI
jgi:[glutamine synthetase] adenylyltransferase / [glutamine synthetase]-adenylyl-L-tyrosine phosphorylase